MFFWKVGESKTKYEFPNRDCIKCAYFQPGAYYSRGAAGGGSRATSSPPTLMCLQSAYRGCPSLEARDYSDARAKQRKQDGWKCGY